MSLVQREEILDYVTYGERREELRAAAMAAKAPRRVALGGNLTLLFENRDTIRYQVQEMVRVEQLVKEEAIRHELDTYNELLGGPGELGATLLVELDDPAERARVLPRWLALPERVYVELEDGRKVRATFDERQRDERRLSAVQFLKFDTGGAAPVAAGVDYPEEELVLRAELSPEQRAALAADLADAAA